MKRITSPGRAAVGVAPPAARAGCGAGTPACEPVVGTASGRLAAAGVARWPPAPHR